MYAFTELAEMLILQFSLQWMSALKNVKNSRQCLLTVQMTLKGMDALMASVNVYVSILMTTVRVNQSIKRNTGSTNSKMLVSLKLHII